MPIFAAFDGVDLHPDHLHAVGLEYAGPVQFGGEIQARLAPQVREQRVGFLLRHHLRHGVQRERFDVGCIRHAGIGHDRGGIRVDEDNLVAQASQGLAGLRAGVIKLASLPNDDRTGTDDQDFLEVSASWHGRVSASGVVVIGSWAFASGGSGSAATRLPDASARRERDAQTYSMVAGGLGVRS